MKELHKSDYVFPVQINVCSLHDSFFISLCDVCQNELRTFKYKAILIVTLLFVFGMIL